MPQKKREDGFNRKRWCGHCSDLVPKSTFYDHVKKYGVEVCGDGDEMCTKRVSTLLVAERLPYFQVSEYFRHSTRNLALFPVEDCNTSIVKINLTFTVQSVWSTRKMMNLYVS